MGPEIVAPVAFFATVVAIVIGLPIARAKARRIEREGGGQKLPAEVTDRLERMEQAIDAIAVEVERISEGQRFATKLLSDRASQGGSLPQGREGGR